MPNRQEVRNRAAYDLGIVRLGQTLRPEDADRIGQAYNEVYAQIKNEGLAKWSVSADIPDDVSPHVVALVADNCLNTYSVSPERFQRIKTASLIAMREIRALCVQPYVSAEEPTDY